MKKYPLWLFILLPAITMLLGWGLRGFIGGGPFGAMIPGAMVMVTICMLLDIPFALSAVMVAFGTAGIAMGGEMTYGQTLGFLRNPSTVWWGTCGTTLKGGVWGLVGGIFIGLGLLYKEIKIKIIITGFFIFLTAFVIGLKLINDPKLIYFSDPVNKPRQESWAGLLFGAIALLIWLKTKITREQFRLIFRFAGFGLLGGALGFGLGGFWLVLGARLGKTSWISEWWKLMEFSFGFIMGGFLGYAAWRSRNELDKRYENTISTNFDVPVVKQLAVITALACFIYLVLPLLDPFVDAATNADGAILAVMRTITRVLINYTFIGCLLIFVAMRWRFVAFQIAITLTFSHTVMDLVDDLAPRHVIVLSDLIMGAIVLLSSIVIGVLVARLQRKQNGLKPMFLLLVWSTVAVALARMLLYSEFKKSPDDSVLKFIIGDLMVFNFFMISAIVISFLAVKRLYNRYG